MFQFDLNFGQIAENEVFALFRVKYPESQQKEGYFREYDFSTGEYEVEVKYDYKANKTGNLCIEKTVDGAPSGIQTTTAKYWVFYLNPKEIRVATPQELLNLPSKDVTFTTEGKIVNAFLIDKELVPILKIIP